MDDAETQPSDFTIDGYIIDAYGGRVGRRVEQWGFGVLSFRLIDTLLPGRLKFFCVFV